MKKIISLILCILLTGSLLSGCGGSDDAAAAAPTASPTEATKPIIPSVRYLNFQPELELAWEELAAAYTADTGIPVTVTTEAPDHWRQTLDTCLSGEDAPTLFQLVSPAADDAWQPLCYDLSRTDAYEQLADGAYALTEGDAALALPCHLEATGIWVNKALLAQAGFRPEDITSQAGLKTIADAIAASAEPLPFAAFAFPGRQEVPMELASVAIALEFQQKNLSEPSAFRGSALDGLHSLLKLLLDNGTQGGLQEFMEGKAIFCPGTSADWDTLSKVFGPEELMLVPAFLDETQAAGDPEETTPEEETSPTEETAAEEAPEPQELCVGASRYWCVNPNAPEQDLDATLDFLDWCLATEEGTAALASLGYELPYLPAPEYRNPFLPAPDTKGLTLRQDWAIPSRQWKAALEAALEAYTAEPTTAHWARAAEVFSDYWAAEYALTDPAEETGDA